MTGIKSVCLIDLDIDNNCKQICLIFQSTYCSTMVRHAESCRRNLKVINLDPAAEYFDYPIMAGKSRTLSSPVLFSRTGLKHRQVISYNRTHEPQAPVCPLRGFVCPLCLNLLSA